MKCNCRRGGAQGKISILGGVATQLVGSNPERLSIMISTTPGTQLVIQLGQSTDGTQVINVLHTAEQVPTVLNMENIGDFITKPIFVQVGAPDVVCFVEVFRLPNPE